MRRLLSAAVLLVLAAAYAPAGDEFPLCCVVDYRNPVAPELLKEAGIQRVYISVGIPLKRDLATGKRVLDPKLKPQLDELFKRYGEHGIKILVASHYYTRPPKGTECVDFWGRTLQMGCFNNDKFLDWMAGTIKDVAEVFSAYDAFGGFMFDDGVHVRVDACYCDLCKTRFKAEYGVDPPPFEPYDGPPRLDPKDARLLWDQFHQKAYNRYLRTQAEAATSFSDKLFLATIPSDSYFYGRQLSSDVAPGETPTRNNARVQRIDRIQVRHWHMFQSFPFPRVTADGIGRARFGVGCHLTTPSPKIIMHHEGPFIERAGRQQFLSPAEISRMMRTTIAEGADAICFWENSRAFPYYTDAFPAIGRVSRDAAKIGEILDERKPFPARIGLLYSTTTEILQQPWRNNTLERWKHLHSFEAMAYALTRAGIQFRIVFDADLSKEALAGLDVLIPTGVTQLTKPTAELLEQAVAAKKLKIVSDRATLPLKGAVVCDFDQDYWFKKQLKGYRQLTHLTHQAAQIRRSVFIELDFADRQPAVTFSASCFGRFFRGRDNSLLIFLVNWDLENEAAVKIQFKEPRTVTDASTGQQAGRGAMVELSVAPAGWRVIRCTK